MVVLVVLVLGGHLGGKVLLEEPCIRCTYCTTVCMMYAMYVVMCVLSAVFVCLACFVIRFCLACPDLCLSVLLLFHFRFRLFPFRLFRLILSPLLRSRSLSIGFGRVSLRPVVCLGSLLASLARPSLASSVLPVCLCPVFRLRLLFRRLQSHQNQDLKCLVAEVRWIQM